MWHLHKLTLYNENGSRKDCFPKPRGSVPDAHHFIIRFPLSFVVNQNTNDTSATCVLTQH